MSDIERFAEVEPLILGKFAVMRDRQSIYLQQLDADQINAGGLWIDELQARALRDWLNQALNEEGQNGTNEEG